MAVSDIPRVLLLLDQGKSMEALELSSKLIAEMPTHVTSYVVHARANESQGQYQNAFTSWRHALDLMPNSPQILKGLLRTADKLSRPAPSNSEDFQFMGWTKDRNEINASRYRFAPVNTVDPELLADPLVTDAAALIAGGAASGDAVLGDATSGDATLREASFGDASFGDASLVDDSDEVPVFVDTDLPDSGNSYELDASGDDSELAHISIDEMQEETIVVTSGDSLDFRAELDATQDSAVTALADAFQTELGDVVADREPVGEDDPEALSAVDNTEDHSRTESEDHSPRESEGRVESAPPKPSVAKQQSTPSSITDLDSLIIELESARIVPRADDDPAPAPNLESDVEGMVSETLARIYAAQTQYAESARIYERLASLHPVREKEFQAKSAEMRSRIS